MTNIYLSEVNPRWSPQSEDDLVSAIGSGLIEETHYLDVKREVETKPSANKELANDLASFAIDSGTLIIGIGEDKSTGKLSLVPQVLNGLPERVEQIARTVPDAPLAVTTSIIPSAADPSIGYVIVQIPSSGSAPHMVNGRYLGRGDKTKHYLSDPEVMRLHQARLARERDGIEIIKSEFERDPILEPKQAHLFLVAVPQTGRTGMLRHATRDFRSMAAFRDSAFTPALKSILKPDEVAPTLERAAEFAQRPDGAALASRHLSSLREHLRGSRSEDAVELELTEDGAIRIFMGRLSDERGGEQQLFDVQMVVYVRQLLALAIYASESTGYLGNWLLAVGAKGLKGLTSYQYRPFSQDEYSPRYMADDYARSAIASYAELVDQPGLLTERLVGRFLRSLETTSRYQTMLSD